MSGSAWSYDTIADVYATDMGLSMPFDDIGYYRKLARSAAGPVLELGCGTGRILLALLADGIDAIGVDRSGPMLARLRRDAEALGLAAPHVAQMDLRALTLQGRFALIVAPYSLVTYLTEAADLDGFIAACRDLLADNGRLVVDAFVPKDVTPFDDFRLDYRRPHGQGFLEREKRIACLAGGSNRIERRYRLLDAESRLMGEWTTVDVIRPYTSDALIAAAARHDLCLVDQVADYEDPRRTASAQFITLMLALSP